MADNKNPFQHSYPGMSGGTDPFGGRTQPAHKSPFPNHGVQSSPFASAAPLAAKSQPPAAAMPPPPLETQQQVPTMMAPPPMPSAFVEPKPEPTNEKLLKGSMPSQVFHDNFNFAGRRSSGSAGFIETKTEAELLESIKSMNTPSHFIRTSVNVLPSSTTLQQKTHIPLGLIIRPMAPLSEDDPEIPLVNRGSEPITRCTRCRTYINPFVQFDGSRRYWTCNLCGVSNETPSRYVNLPVNGDKDSLPPELKTGVVNYIASADYMVRPPQAPTIMFVIDVSVSSVNSGMLETVCQTISDLIENHLLPGDQRTLVGIVTYDTSVHFYQMSGPERNLSIMVVSDLEDLFLPLPGEILLNVSESADDILNLLSLLPSTWKNTNIAGSCMGSALRAAHFAMKHIGGKMCVFTASPSYFGDFSLNANSMSQKKSGASNLQPIEKCKDYSTMICQTQVCVELFVCTQQSVNLSSLYHLSALTAGNIHYVPLKSHVGGVKLSEELRHVLTRETGWEAVMRIRVSKGWKITNWFGHCYIRGSDLMVLPNCHSDQSFTITFEHEDNVVTKNVAYFQAALLHTTSGGERRISVSTYALPVSDNFSEILMSVDPEAAVATAAQLAIMTGLNGKIGDARTQLQTLCSRISNAMSTINSLQNTTGKIVMYMFGLLKSPCFSEGNTTVDMRVYNWMRLISLPIKELSVYCYPRLIRVSDLTGDFGVNNADGFPPSLNLTHSSLSQEAAYLLENGDTMILWIGKAVSSQWLQSVFDVPSLDELNCELAESFMNTCKSPAAVRLVALIRSLRSLRLPYMSLQVTKQGDESEIKFFSCLIEDKTPGMMLTLNEFVSTITLRSPFHFKPSA
ncbi:putative Sec 24 protein transport protein [Babesia divergens]|uniref:Sec 24 protein transport protein n=1 Tax=Babesia divergens TaxID=32595 RepID=A0AAD9GFG7_BABDI|nr:putative Sec 24 protein transport protein [Babesia divergens]